MGKKVNDAFKNRIQYATAELEGFCTGLDINHELTYVELAVIVGRVLNRICLRLELELAFDEDNEEGQDPGAQP